MTLDAVRRLKRHLRGAGYEAEGRNLWTHLSNQGVPCQRGRVVIRHALPHEGRAGMLLAVDLDTHAVVADEDRVRAARALGDRPARMTAHPVRFPSDLWRQLTSATPPGGSVSATVRQACADYLANRGQR